MSEALTVRELIALLSQEDPESPVWIEGCDCTGSARSVSVEAGDDYNLVVLIERNP